MSNLRPNLFDTNYDRLVALGRSLIPRYAPTWTDHNIHDPGIMLLELLAWTAEAQTYSLARMRRDERWAYGALLGFERQGPLPAHGLIWPESELRTQGYTLEENLPISAEQIGIPAFRLRRSIYLTPAKLIAVESQLHDGARLNHTAANEHPGVMFFPFGELGIEGDRLILTFTGPLVPNDSKDSTVGLLSLGVRVPLVARFSECKNASLSSEEMQGFIPDTSSLMATLLEGQRRYPLPVQLDETGGFLHTGVILLDISHLPDKIRSESKLFAIEFESRGNGLVRPPHVLRISQNVLPVEQSEVKEITFSFAGNDNLPDRRILLEDRGVRWQDIKPIITVTVGSENWEYTEDLSKTGPDDKKFSFEREAREIKFGNGLNGKMVPNNIPVHIVYDVTDGSLGNLPAGQVWSVRGLTTRFGKNEDPITGGADELNLLELRRLARESIRKSHSIVTQQDLEQAALELCDLQVARAKALPMIDPGRNCPVLPYLRTLVVLRKQEEDLTVLESPQWLAEIQRLLSHRLLLGEKLLVVAPHYVDLEISATLITWPGLSTEDVQNQAMKALDSYFALTADDGSAEVWPFGRSVQELDVKARLRNVDSVRVIKECKLSWKNPTGERIVIPVFSQSFLPRWDRRKSLIQVERGPIGG